MKGERREGRGREERKWEGRRKEEKKRRRRLEIGGKGERREVR